MAKSSLIMKKLSLYSCVKYLYILPLVSVALSAFACPKFPDVQNDILSAKVSNLASDVEIGVVSRLNPSFEEIPAPQDSIFEFVEEKPEFPGGMQAMMKYLAENIKYPSEITAQGRAVIQFTVGKDGSISDARIMRSVSPEYDAEALRVVNSMPKWKPGKHHGEAVATKFTVPVIFRLSNPQEDNLVAEGEEIYIVAEEMPEFPGGMDAVLQYLADNIKYPSIAMNAGVQGRLITQFTIATDGSISDAKVVHKVDPFLDKEALRVINAMPKWKPGKQGGKVVPIQISVPVEFRITNSVKRKNPDSSTIYLKVDDGVSKGVVNEIKKYLRKDTKLSISYNSTSKSKKGSAKSREDAKPLVVVDGMEKGVGVELLKTIAPADIASVELFQEDNAIEMFGEKAVGGAVFVITKKAENFPFAHVKSVILPGEGQSPLIIVDGVEKDSYHSAFNQMDIHDILSISVLKADSGIRKYGEKAQNGVVLITTKKINN